jgi:hypothetical protein
MDTRSHLFTAVVLSSALWAAPALATDPLPKKAIVDFVRAEQPMYDHEHPRRG